MGLSSLLIKQKLATATDRALPNDQPHDQRVTRRKQDLQSYLAEQRNAEKRLELWHQQVDLGLQKPSK
ncbi:hypothetical protein PEC18_35450 [Paucibacter sp. O1-1]|nr:hypothetical protein [Paucibacter sp. O1-1]MDA3830963.1 hypothetical protein [Paucibacter sp. O1-1]